MLTHVPLPAAAAAAAPAELLGFNMQYTMFQCKNLLTAGCMTSKP